MDSFSISNNDYVKTSFDLYDAKKNSLDKFITYRRRLSRMALVQAIYVYDFSIIPKSSDANQVNLFSINNTVKPDIFAHAVMYFYKNYFFTQSTYGLSKRNRKIDEYFLFKTVDYIISNLDYIDGKISNYLSKDWKLQNLDILIKSILRAGIAEQITSTKTNKSIITSEYTNIASKFFTGRQTSFINGVLHNYCAKEIPSEQN